MELLTKLERTILGWLKNVPHLPVGVRTWLGENVWWIAIIGAAASGISALVMLVKLFDGLAALSSPFVSFFVSTSFVVWLVVGAAVSLVFMAVNCLLLALSVNPLKARQKKGWTLLFIVWLVGLVSVVVSAALTLNALGVFTTLIFGAIGLAISGYFLFEIHGEFAQVQQSRGVKAEKKASKA